MIALPGALAPWADLLGLFPPEVAADLGRWIPRLALAVGPMRTSRPTGRGEPDGFSGIARRGSYERLLLTEWLLADELPDEFARRAAMGEHTFHELARRTPARAMSSVALFDAGPAQLGAPRLAHLAVLVVLAARAERADARFAWGVLHEPAGALFTTVTAESVRSLLGARTALSPTPDDAVAWAARAKQSGWEDAWIVGPAAGSRWRHASLEVRDVLEPDRRALAVVVRSPGAPPREAELELPDERACVRLLRDPFSVAAPAFRSRKSGVVPLQPRLRGQRHQALGAQRVRRDRGVPRPQSPHESAGRPKRYRSWKKDRVVAAVGWVKRALVMLTVTEDEIILEHTTPNGPRLLRRSLPRPADNPIAVPHAADPLAPLIYRDDGGAAEVFFLDARRSLHRIWRDRLSDVNVMKEDAVGEARVDRLASEVSALAELSGRIAFVGRNADAPPDVDREMVFRPLAEGQLPPLDDGWQLVFLAGAGAPGSMERLPGSGTFEVRFGFTEGPLPSRGIVAVQNLGDDWSILDDTRSPPVIVKAPSDARVIGVWRSGAGSAPELLVLDPDQRSIHFAGPREGRALPRAHAPIVDVVLCTSRSQLAYVTTAGEVVIHSLSGTAPLARFTPEEPR